MPDWLRVRKPPPKMYLLMLVIFFSLYGALSYYENQRAYKYAQKLGIYDNEKVLRIKTYTPQTGSITDIFPVTMVEYESGLLIAIQRIPFANAPGFCVLLLLALPISFILYKKEISEKRLNKIAFTGAILVITLVIAGIWSGLNSFPSVPGLN